MSTPIISPSHFPFLPLSLTFGSVGLVLGAFCDYDTIYFFCTKHYKDENWHLCIGPLFLFFGLLFLLFFLGYDFMGSRFCIYNIQLRIRFKMALVIYI